MRDNFATQLEQLEADPARVLSNVGLDQVFSQTEALVTVEGEEMLLESSIPLRVPEERGDLRKVDLGLEETERGYSPANPLVDLSLPETAAKPIYVGDSGLAISVEGARSDATARTFGEADLFLPEAGVDSSLLLSPSSGGVDISTLLLSRESPEQFSFAMTLPGDATLRASESGGAEVLAGDGRQLAYVNVPRAVDAQGVEVPVTLEVEGRSLIVDVPHRSMDVAYPLLVDPEVIENWSGWSDPSVLNYWKWQWGGVAEKDYLGKTSCIVTCWGSGNGLYVRSKSNFTYPAGSFGRWWFTAQGTTTYMRRVVVGPMNLDPHGCTANEPHAYTGVWNEGGWWSVLANAYPSGWGSYIDTGSGSLGEGTRTAFVGIGAASNSNIKCGRDYALGGATFYLDDPEAPTITSVTGLPSGWVKGNTQITAKATATDPGLGVQKIRAIGGPAGEWWWDQSPCAGTMKEPCAATRSGQISFNTNGLFEGKGSVAFQPYDPTGKASNSKSYEVWVDRVPPTIDLEGQLAEATHEKGKEEVPAGEGDDLSLPTYNLKVETADATSGVKSIEVFLDSKASPEETKTQPCTGGGCPFSWVYPLKLTGLKPGPHVLRIVATDQAGNKTPEERKIEFEYTPATGIKDEYVMQYIPLPDGQDHSDEAESRGPEIAVNVVNGNVVYHERDFQVEGRDANLELERSYNSQLPTEKDTRWGHGWTVAQLPELESQPAEPSPTEATMLRASGALTSSVSIPTSTTQRTFDPKLHATVEKVAGGGYGVSYEDREEENVFDSTGELKETAYPSGAALQIDYKGEYKYITPAYSSSFGSHGTGDGLVAAPGDLTFDSAGNIWLIDQGNNRVEKFNPKGEFLAKFGSYGTGNGQFHMPSAIAIDEKGNLWVADTENSRIEELAPDGKYLSQFGSEGTGNGQLGRPEGIAIDSKGNIWVADTYNSRIQEFSSAGTFVKSFGSFGTGAGQFYNPTGIDFGPGDTLWVTDWSNSRVTELDASGKVLREFGSKGNGTGQFEHPDTVDVDSTGRVWVGDEGNDRIEVFSADSGAYIAQFGAKGTAAGQFSFAFPMGVASDGKGHLWVSDAKNNRVQKWTVGEFVHGDEITGMTVEEPDPWTDSDISAELETAKGLVQAVDAEGAAESHYSYESGLLTAEQDGEGETSYGYDSSNRLSLIELPNGTTASIEYDALSRATAVTVDPAGEEGAKTTKFKYVDEPRETRVSGAGNPEVIYSIANDGSVFKWNYAAEPPKFASLGGTLWEHRNSTTPLTTGDQSFSATAESAHQIAEVQVLINGEVAAEEKACEDDPETPKHECQQVTLEWVTNTAAHPAGQLNLEVVATDFLGNSVGEKFFATIPQQPESESEAPVEPTFENVKKFREEFGLDYESGRTESEITKLIFELLEEWKLEKPIARWSEEEWGVPLRESEIKELEYRDQYIAQAAEAIPVWAESHAASTYAGYYVDELSGGQIYVGFTTNQQSNVEALRQEAGLTAPDRVSAFPNPPTTSQAALLTTEAAVEEVLLANEAAFEDTTEIGINPENNVVRIGATDPTNVSASLKGSLGPSVPIEAYYDELAMLSGYTRYQESGPMQAGDYIKSSNKSCGSEKVCWSICTAGYGAKDQVGEQRGHPIFGSFVMTAGHCFAKNDVVYRARSDETAEDSRIGKVTRYTWGSPGKHTRTDAEAFRVDGDSWWIKSRFVSAKKASQVKPATKTYIGMKVCSSGVSSLVKCGKVLEFVKLRLEDRFSLEIKTNGGNAAGDSGGPAWDRKTGRSVGLTSARSGPGCHLIAKKREFCPFAFITPLRPFPKGQNPNPPGALDDLNLSLVTGS